MKILTTQWKSDQPNRVVSRFLARPAFDDQAQDVAQGILSEVKRRGMKAVLDYAEKFDGARLTASTIKVTPEELQGANQRVDVEFKKAAREACRRIELFARSGMKKNWRIKTPHGGTLGELFVPYDRVGVYVPGGAAPLASTALMTATLARVAGVPSIVACTPLGKDGDINPYVLYALKLAGATEIFKVGGVHAIGLMAYGSRAIQPVQKIVGPGGTYVTAAKRLVYGDVALDLVAGPSEIAILADDTADPVCVALDLLSQAEHGTGHEKALLVCSSPTLIEKVRVALVEQTAALSRSNAIKRVAMNGGLLLACVDNLDEGIELCNRFAPEHLELIVKSPRRWVRKVRSAGAVFMGPWTPESVGDFVAGPSHVLPTGGAATMFSGLTVDDFLRRSSFVEFSKRDLSSALHVIEAFGRVEGLDAHARSASIRFDEQRKPAGKA